MSRVIGLLLLLGLLGAALFSIGLLMWVWIASSNDSGKAPATPKPSAQIYFSQPTEFTLVDSRWQSFQNEVACA